jgi:hypothetical protein
MSNLKWRAIPVRAETREVGEWTVLGVSTAIDTVVMVDLRTLRVARITSDVRFEVQHLNEDILVALAERVYRERVK